MTGATRWIARYRVRMGFVAALAAFWLARPTRDSLAVGALVAAAGELIRIWAAGHLEKGREVTMSGPYRLTRHPLYLGSGLIAAGLAIASSSVAVVLLVAIYFAVTIASAIRSSALAPASSCWRRSCSARMFRSSTGLSPGGGGGG